MITESDTASTDGGGGPKRLPAYASSSTATKLQNAQRPMASFAHDGVDNRFEIPSRVFVAKNDVTEACAIQKAFRGENLAAKSVDDGGEAF